MESKKLFSSAGFFGYRLPYAEFQTQDKETLRYMGKIGVNPIILSPMNTATSLGVPYSPYPPIWRWYGSYDFDLLDKQFKDVLHEHPDADFIVMVDLNSPMWLARQMCVDSFYDISECALDERWCNLMLDYLEKFLTHCETSWKNRIRGYLLACGRTQEWIEYNAMKAGLRKTANYPAWCKKEGLPLLPIPNGAELKQAAKGIVFDPATQQHIIQWQRYSCAVTADLAIRFVSAARQWVRPGLELGYFFGHVVHELSATGHNDVERAFRTAPPNFQIGAACNCPPEMGAGGGDIGIDHMYSRYGVRYVHEVDRILSTSNTTLGGGDIRLLTEDNAPIWRGTQNSAEDIACIRREMAFALIRKQAIWWFNIWGNAFRTSEVRNELASMKKLWEDYAPRSTGSDADILVVYDPESCYYLNSSAPECAILRQTLSRAGLAFDTALTTDLAYGIPDRYRLVIFQNPVHLTSQSLQHIRENVLKNNRTILWLLGPGLVTDDRYSPETVRELTGFEPGSAGLCSRDFAGYRSLFAADARVADTPEVLKKIAAEAGCHAFLRNIPAAWWSSPEFLMIHTAKGGRDTVYLKQKVKQVTELFSGRVIAENTDHFETGFQAPETVLYYLSPL